MELAVKFNRATRAAKQKHCENNPTDTPLSVQEEGGVPTNHALMAQDHYMAQQAYITPKQLVHVYDTRKNTPAVRGVKFKDDLPGNLRVDHWKAI